MTSGESACNRCLESGRFPSILKRADLDVLKKGEDRDPGIAGSYRSICLLSNLGKLLKRLVCARLQEHRANRGVHPNQYGFRPPRSIDDALNRVMEEVQTSGAKYVMALFVDIAGAFDNLWWRLCSGSYEEWNVQEIYTEC